MHCIILYGMPCSGKSTIGKQLSMKYGYKYISSGNIAREMARCSQEIDASLRSGKLAPEEMMRQAIAHQIRECIVNNNDIILDGFPRFVGQYEWLKSLFNGLNCITVNIDISEQTAINRALNRGRDDDISINSRIEYYKKYTYPLAIQSNLTLNNETPDGNIRLVDIIYTEVMKQC